MSHKVAIITGASSGIGRGLAIAALDRGYAVVGTARRATTAAQLSPSDRLVLIDGDVGEPVTAARVVDAALDRWGRVDLLVNNAGIFIPRPFDTYAEADFTALVATNLAGFFHMTRRAIVPMLAAGAGHIVNVTTSLVTQPIAGVPAALPILTKGGLEAATRALAIEYAGRGVRVNAVAPGIVDTPMHPAENHAFLRTLHPIERLATVREIADAVLYLDGAGFVSGEVLHVDGGAHAGKW